MDVRSESLSWVEHLEELRKRLFTVLGALAAASVVSYFFSEPLFQLFILPIRQLHEKLYFTTPYEAFLVKLQIAFFSGFILSSPVTLFQLWFFVAPGLYEKEKKVTLLLVASTLVCFLGGIVFAFFAVIPFAIQFFLGFQSENLKPLLSIKEYFSFLVSFLIGFGVAFDVPVFLLLLVKAGVLPASALARQRKLAVVIIFILAALLTPSPDVISQLLLAVPLLILFEGSIWAARWIERRPKS